MLPPKLGPQIFYYLVDPYFFRNVAYLCGRLALDQQTQFGVSVASHRTVVDVGAADYCL